MSVYTQFVKEHIHSAPGKSMKEKMRAVAVMWRRHKGKGKGLSTPGSHVGKGSSFSDYGMKPQLNGEGLWDDVKGLAKKAVKAIAPKGVDKLVGLASDKLGSLAGKHFGPQAESLVRKAVDYGGSKLGTLIKKKIEGFGLKHAREHLKHHMSMHPPKGHRRMAKKGGALSGMVSPRQMAALRAHIRGKM